MALTWAATADFAAPLNRDIPESQTQRHPEFESSRCGSSTPDLVGTGHPRSHLDATRSGISLSFLRVTWSTLLGFCVPSAVCVRRSWISQVRHATRMSCGRIRLRGAGTGAMAARKPWNVDPHALSAAHLRVIASHPRFEGFCVCPNRRVFASHSQGPGDPSANNIQYIHPPRPPLTSRLPLISPKCGPNLLSWTTKLLFSALDRQSSFGGFQTANGTNCTRLRSRCAPTL